MAKSFRTDIVLGAKVNSSLQKAFSTISKGTKAISQKAGQALSSMAKTGAIAAAGTTAGVIALGSSSLKAYENQMLQEEKLATVLKQRTNATDKQIQSVQKYASAIQKQGVIGDEVLLAGSQQVATFVKQTESVNTLMPAMANLLTQQKGLNATEQDSVNIANMMGKVLTGQTGALKRVGISFSDTEEKMIKSGDEQQKVATLAQIITNNVGKMNKALAETGPGKIQQVKNRLGDVKEVIGKGVNTALVGLLPIIEKVTVWFENSADKVALFFEKVGIVAENTFGAISSLISGDLLTFTAKSSNILQMLGLNNEQIVKIQGFIVRVKGHIDNFITTIGTSFSKFDMSGFLDTLIAMGDTIFPIITQLTTMLLPPIMQITSALVPIIQSLLPPLSAIIGVIIEVLNQLIAILVPILLPIMQQISGLISALNPLISFLCELIGNSLVNVFNIIQPVLQFFTGMISNIILCLQGLTNFITGVFTGNWSLAWQGIQQMFSASWGNIVNTAKSAVNIISGIINSLTGGWNNMAKTLSKIPGMGWAENLQIPKIPMLAKGGVITHKTVAMLAERPGLIESVVPHTKTARSQQLALNAAKATGAIKDYTGQAANAINNRQTSFSNKVELNIYTTGKVDEVKQAADEAKYNLEEFLDEYFRKKGLVTI